MVITMVTKLPQQIDNGSSIMHIHFGLNQSTIHRGTNRCTSRLIHIQLCHQIYGHKKWRTLIDGMLLGGVLC